MEFNFFLAFDNDMMIMLDHIMNPLEMSVEINKLKKMVVEFLDRKVYVQAVLEDCCPV